MQFGQQKVDMWKNVAVCFKQRWFSLQIYGGKKEKRESMH